MARSPLATQPHLKILLQIEWKVPAVMPRAKLLPSTPEMRSCSSSSSSSSRFGTLLAHAQHGL